ncbi:MAG: TonB-dependent receptor [Rhodothermales bacterium]
MRKQPFDPIRALLVAALLAVAAPSALAQTAALRGFVTDDDDGQALPGVNVVVEDAAGELRGTATDVNGFYYLPAVPPGRHVLRATYLGYDPYVDSLALEPGEVLQLDIRLTTGQTELDAVTVESERTSGAANVTAGLQSIRVQDIELVPTPDVSGDLASYLSTVPGIVSTGDRGGQLFIRGGEPSQNQVLIDGITLYQPFHVLGFYSAFPSDILNRADLYAGGYDARFGGQLSSVLDVATRSGNKRRFNASASVAPFVSAVTIEGPLVPDRASFLGSGRISVIEQGASQLVDQELPYDFGDVFGKLHVDVAQSGQLSVTALHTWDRGVVGNLAAPRPDEVRWENTAFGGRYVFVPTRLPILAEVLLTGSRFSTELGPRDPQFTDPPPRMSDIEQFGTEVNMTQYLRVADLQAGVFLRTTTVESALGGAFQNLETERDHVTEAGAYLMPEFRIGGGLDVAFGLRLTTLPNQGQTFLEPRGRVKWQAGPHQLSGAAGLYNQPVVGVADRRDATSIFTAWTIAPEGQTPQAIHAIAGYRVTPTPWLDVAVEGYYKDLANLSVGEFTAFPRLTTRLQSAEGDVKGMDARVEVRAGRFYGFANYGLASVNYAASSERYETWFGEETIEYRPSHDRRHQVNALVSVDVAGFDLSARWQFGSGLPFSSPLGFDVFVLMDGVFDPYSENGTPRVVYDRPFNAELPTYHRLDVSVERTFELNRLSLTAQAGLINAYDRRNLFAYDVFTLQRVDQLPVVPTFGLKAAFN